MDELKEMIRKDPEVKQELLDLYNTSTNLAIGTKAMNYAGLAVAKVELEHIAEKAILIHGRVVHENRLLKEDRDTLLKKVEANDPEYKLPTKIVRQGSVNKEIRERTLDGLNNLAANWR